MPPWLNRLFAMAAKGLGDALTERDNVTLDIKRICGAATLMFTLAAKGYDLFWRKGELDFMTMCQGLAVVLASLGAILAINRNTEHGE